MARYYFHWRNPNGLAPDLTGEELRNSVAAMAAARELAEQITNDSSRDWPGYSIEVADQDGRIVGTLPMSDRRLPDPAELETG